MKKRKYRTRLIHVTHLVIIVSSYLYILLSKRREKSKAGRCVLREQEKTITNQHTKKITFIHSHIHIHVQERERKSHTHTHRQRQFIPYFSETETSGDIISEREREKEKGSVEQAKRKTKKNSFFFISCC